MNQNDAVRVTRDKNWRVDHIKQDRLTHCRSNRRWYDLSYAKGATNQNGNVSMIWGVIQQNEHIISNRDRLTPCREIADDDMIWVIK